MSGYVLSRAARADLEQIWDYTFELWGDAQAEEYVREIQRAIERIVDNPMIGRAWMKSAPATGGTLLGRTGCTTAPAATSSAWCASFTNAWMSTSTSSDSCSEMSSQALGTSGRR